MYTGLAVFFVFQRVNIAAIFWFFWVCVGANDYTQLVIVAARESRNTAENAALILYAFPHSPDGLVTSFSARNDFTVILNLNFQFGNLYLLFKLSITARGI